MTEVYHSKSRKVLSDHKSYFELDERTGVGTIQLFSDYLASYDLSDGTIPALTSKYVPIRIANHELIWMLQGCGATPERREANIGYLLDNDVDIWTDNAWQRYLRINGLEEELPKYTPEWREARAEWKERGKEDKEFVVENMGLGPMYGVQWRFWELSNGETFDQVRHIINQIRENPSSRRIRMTAWNRRDLHEHELPPCHSDYLFKPRKVDGEAVLDMKLEQRSGDMFLGVPFNMVTASNMLKIMANQSDMKPGRFVHDITNAHFYCGRGDRAIFYRDNLSELRERIVEVADKREYLDVLGWINDTAPSEENVEDPKHSLDHVTAILEQLSREIDEFPTIKIKNRDIDDLTIEDFEVNNYNPRPSIRRQMAV